MKQLVLSWATVQQLENLPHVKDRMFRRGGFTRREDGAFVIEVDDRAFEYIMAHGTSHDGAVRTMMATMAHRRD